MVKIFFREANFCISNPNNIYTGSFAWDYLSLYYKFTGFVK